MSSILEGFEKRLIGEKKAESTRRSYLRVARRMLEMFPDMQSLSEGDALAFRDELAAQVGQNTLVIYTCGINAFMAYQGKAIRLRPPRWIQKAVKPLSQEDCARLLKGAGDSPDPLMARRNVAIMLLLLEGAARQGEVRKMLLADVDLGAGTLMTRAPKGKDDSPIYLSRPAVDALEGYLEVRPGGATPEDDRYLFLTGKRARLGTDAIKDMVKRAAARGGIERRVYPHLLRHTKLTQLAQEGASPFVIRQFARHVRLETTMRYVNLADETVKNEVQARPLVTIEPKAMATRLAPPLAPEDLRRALAARLAMGEISEATYNRALSSLESPLEELR